MAVRNGRVISEGLRDGTRGLARRRAGRGRHRAPRLRRAARTIAGVYDLQHDPTLQDADDLASPSTGEPGGALLPHAATTPTCSAPARALEIVADCVQRHARPLARLRQHPGDGLRPVRRHLRPAREALGRQSAGLPGVYPRTRPSRSRIRLAIRRSIAASRSASRSIPTSRSAWWIRPQKVSSYAAPSCSRPWRRSRMSCSCRPTARVQAEESEVRARLCHPDGHARAVIHLPREFRHGPLPLGQTALRPVRGDGRAGHFRRRAGSLGPDLRL